jgi:transposase
MRYELSDYEWTAIKPMLPNKQRGVRRVNDRLVLNGIFLGSALWCTMARPAGDLWSPHHLLQSSSAGAAVRRWDGSPSSRD